MPLTTVLLADLPPMLEDMMSSMLENRLDVRVVRGTTVLGDLVAAASANGARVVVVTRRDPTDLVAVDPRVANAAALSIIALAPDGSWACVHGLRPEADRLDDVSIDEILATLGTAATKGLN